MGMNDTLVSSDYRGVSTTVSFVLAVAITAILVGGLLLGVGGLMEDQQDRTLDNELRILSERVATDLTTIEQAASTTDDRIVVTKHAPRTLAGQTYTVQLVDDCQETYTDACVRLESGERSHTVPIRLNSSVSPASVPGGTFWIVQDNSTITITGEQP